MDTKTIIEEILRLRFCTYYIRQFNTHVVTQKSIIPFTTLLYFIKTIKVLSRFVIFIRIIAVYFLRQHDQDRRESRPPSQPWVHSGGGKKEVEQQPGPDWGERRRSRVPTQDKHV